MCIHNLQVSMGFKKQYIEPVTKYDMVDRQYVVDRLFAIGIQPISIGTPFDSHISITSKKELDRTAPGLVTPADLYIAEIADCEDYGMKAQIDASFTLHVSSIRLCLGWMPDGYHGFAITMDDNGDVWWLEPNAGFEYAGVWHKIGEEDYRPDKVLI